MRKSILLVLLFNIGIGFSQADLLNTTSSDDLKKVSVLPENEESIALEYAKVSDEDIVFSFTVWEVIDLDERVNFPYLYPVDVFSVTPDRRPLIHHLMEGIKEFYFPSYFDDKFSEEITEEDFIKIQVYKVLKDGVDADGITEGIEHFEFAGSWREHLESLGYIFPDEEWVKYDPLSDDYLELEDDVKLSEYRKNWEEVAIKMMPDTDFNSAEFEYADVRKYVIKGVWYFDRISTELKYRPIAIGPIATTAQDKYDSTNDDTSNLTDDSVDTSGYGAFDDDDDENAETEVVDSVDTATEVDLEEDSESDSFFPNQTTDNVSESDKEFEPMFWVFYPDVREVLSNAYAFNEKNMSKPFSFDRLINSRRFSATIYKEANVYQDRDVRDYIRNNALMQLLESERIKEKIRNKEQDMWNY